MKFYFRSISFQFNQIEGTAAPPKERRESATTVSLSYWVVLPFFSSFGCGAFLPVSFGLKEENEKSSIPVEWKHQCPSGHLHRRYVQRRQNRVDLTVNGSRRDASGEARSERTVAEAVQGMAIKRDAEVLGVCFVVDMQSRILDWLVTWL